MAVRSPGKDAKLMEIVEQPSGEDKRIGAVLSVFFDKKLVVVPSFSQGWRWLYGTIIPGQTLFFCVGHDR